MWLKSIRDSSNEFVNKATLVILSEQSYDDLRNDEDKFNLKEKEIVYYHIGRDSFAFLRDDVSETREKLASRLDIYRFQRWNDQKELLAYLKAIMIPFYLRRKGSCNVTWNEYNKRLLEKYGVYGIDLERHRNIHAPSLVIDLENRYIFVREDIILNVKEVHSQHDISAYHTSTSAVMSTLLFNVNVAGKEVDVIPIIGEFYEITVRRQKGALVKLDKNALLNEAKDLLEDLVGKYLVAFTLATVTTPDKQRYIYHAYYHEDSDPFWIQIMRDYIETLRPQEIDGTLVDTDETSKMIHKYYRNLLLEIGLQFEVDLQNSFKG